SFEFFYKLKGATQAPFFSYQILILEIVLSSPKNGMILNEIILRTL
ncbi:hypothetical protein KKC_07737, partial [Listeria fleischmannii subsp. coloradonensis]